MVTRPPGADTHRLGEAVRRYEHVIRTHIVYFSPADCDIREIAIGVVEGS